MPLVETKKITVHPDYIGEVGKLCAAWSYFEMITDRLLWGILDVNEKVGSIISSQKEMAGRWSLIINNSENRLTPFECDLCLKINKALAAVIADRNIVVHGQIFLETETSQPYACITRGANAGNWFPVTKDAVEIIIHNIAFLAEASKKIANSHKWLDEPPHGPPVSDWPKLIQGFS